MATITRDVAFGKLGGLAMSTLQSAYELARVRGDGYIEPIHWLAIWMRTDGSGAEAGVDTLPASTEPSPN